MSWFLELLGQKKPINELCKTLILCISCIWLIGIFGPKHSWHFYIYILQSYYIQLKFCKMVEKLFYYPQSNFLWKRISMKEFVCRKPVLRDINGKLGLFENKASSRPKDWDRAKQVKDTCLHLDSHSFCHLADIQYSILARWRNAWLPRWRHTHLRSHRLYLNPWVHIQVQVSIRYQ